MYLKLIASLSGSARRTLRDEGLISTIRKTGHFLAARLTGRRRNVPNVQRWESTFSLVLPEDGTTPARRPDISSDVAIKVPFANRAPLPDFKLAVVVHVFYVEMFDEIIDLIVTGIETFTLFVSTDTEEKRTEVEEILRHKNVKNYEIRIFPNRGRDIAAKVVGFADVYDKFDILLHLHTERLPRFESLVGWRSYLLRNLIGSREIVKSNISLLLAPSNVGLVFPQHFPVVRGQLSWENSYGLTSDLLGRMGYPLSKDALLEFPSGSMFWARTAALKPLVDLKISYDDFAEELGKSTEPSPMPSNDRFCTWSSTPDFAG